MALSAAEQFMLELTNRARLDPVGEAARFGIDLNRDLFAGRLHAASRGALAPDAVLEQTAISHSLWMLGTDIFSHTGINGSTPTDRAKAAGHDGRAVAENISWRGTTGALDAQASILQQHADLFLSAGHRVNMLIDTVREVGIAQEIGVFTSGRAYNASMVTQNFSSQDGAYFVTGVVYSDADHDTFYSIGEGLGGWRLASGGTTSFSTSAGGYGLQVAGTGGAAVLVTGTAAGGGDFSVKVAVEGQNAKLDIVNGQRFLASTNVELVSGIQRVKLLGAADINATGNASGNWLEGNSGGNTLQGGGGADRIWGMDGNDHLTGGWGADFLSGGAGADTLSGGAGIDGLTGNIGNDYLTGDAGNDFLTGGAGADRFVFGLTAGQDVVTDFSPDDRLLIDDAIWGGAIYTGAQLIAAHATVVKSDVVIALGIGQFVTLDGVSSVYGLADRIVFV